MLIADLHVHSNYSRATSKDSVPEYLDLWARRKGLSLVGTGDFTHPAWRSELGDKLVPAEEGLYRLRSAERIHQGGVPEGEPRFVVTGEIGSIYKKEGRVRRVHTLILLPSLAAADTLSRKLETIGDLHTDGRPTLNLDSRDLLEMTLESCPEAVFIPAHIWTPHASLLGRGSGFDTVEACFGDLTPYIHALETGLSSDPAMNGRLSALDGYQLVSNSDAHSPAKLGREANLLEIAPSYSALRRALETGEGLEGTIEFFPQESKYYLDGHRKCKICLTPAETAAAGGFCPVCGKKITTGVLHRVEELADRPEGTVKPGAKRFEGLVPLAELIAVSEGGSVTGKKVNGKYAALLQDVGPELYILRQAPLEEIEQVAGFLVADGIRRLRLGQVQHTPGYDGAYGTLDLPAPERREGPGSQICLFSGGLETPRKKKRKQAEPPAAPAASHGAGESLNARQALATTAGGRVISVVAGPGTGKTETLVARIAYLVEGRGVKPHEITAVTFTNRAAAQLRERVEHRLGGRGSAGMTIGTLPSICLDLLSRRPEGGSLVECYEALEIAGEVCADRDRKLSPEKLLEGVSRRKNSRETDVPEEMCADYCRRLEALDMLDLDDLPRETAALWRDGAFGRAAEKRFHHLLVDEFQEYGTIQYALIQAWARKGESLFVVGDPDQATCELRETEPGCFARLEHDFPDLFPVHLTTSYRSTPEIVSAALSIIDRSGGPRELKAAAPSGAAVRLLAAKDDLDEADFVAREIVRMVDGVDMRKAGRGGAWARKTARSFGDVAVFCRTRQQLSLLEEHLVGAGIPSVVAGRDDILTDSGVRGVLCQLRHLLDPDDVLALRGALTLNWNCPPDLSASVAGQWTLMEGEPEEKIRTLLSLYAQVPYVEQWGTLELELRPKARRAKPRKLLKRIAAGTEWGDTEALRRLYSMAAFYPDGADLLRNLTLGRESDLLRSTGPAGGGGAVHLMPLGVSRGLEFPVVFLCGVKAGTIPLESEHPSADEQEERRLFYVGMTRAKEELILLTRRKGPSRFLADLPERGIERGKIPPREPEAEEMQLCLF